MTNPSLEPQLSNLSRKTSEIRFESPASGEEGNACIHEAIAENAVRQSDSLAVRVGTRNFSYGELETRASSLASQLRSFGVGPDVVVAICMRRSFAMVISALAVLKAGGAYLPIDPANPPARLAYMLSDSQVKVVVTSECNRERVPAGDYEIIELNDEGQSKGSSAVSFQPISVKPSNLAYVIYTSGSTGQPKGVEITHGNLSNLVAWHVEAFSVTPVDRASQFSAVGFDAAVWELWPYLVAGASLHIPEDGLLADPAGLRDWILAQRITIGFLPTPVAERVMMLPWPPMASFRFLLTGADTLHHYPAAKLPFALVNNYGPTECTVVTTSGVVAPEKKSSGLPPIGRPITNMKVYVLDEKMREVQAGDPGELYIGGAGVGRGYRNRPELTAERFVRNPFSTGPGDRLYKTGDLVRLLPDGQIAFLGRTDEQIKIRGFRIEPGEIVATLNEHPLVRESAVVPREFGVGDMRLVAYVVAEPNASVTHSALRNHLATTLPEHMIPAVFVRIGTLPLNTSGKLDRAALPEPEATNSLAVDTYEAPRTPVEERIAEILAPLLELERVGVADNFFMLGGHSLLGTQVIARVRDAFGIELSLRTVFDSPTVAGLAAEVEQSLLAKLEAMSEEEAEEFLRAKTQPAPEGV